MNPVPDRPSQEEIAAEILQRVEAAGSSSSICPSEVARALAPAEQWRSLMSPVRRAAMALQADGRIDILRKGKPVEAAEVRGVIRLRLRPS